MAIEIDLGSVPTGSLALGFHVSAPDTVPEVVEIRWTDAALTETTSDPLTVYATGKPDYKLCDLTEPLVFGETYSVEVLFDGIVVHTEEIDMPTPGRRRSPVLRQRIFETILSAYKAGDVVTVPYGNVHMPATVDQGVKSLKGIVVEVGPAYIENMDYDNRKTLTRDVTVPLKGYISTDSEEDTEDLTAAFEELLDYLLETSWRLNSFGLIQSSATCDAGEPSINEDRRLAIIEGGITVPMRRHISADIFN